MRTEFQCGKVEGSGGGWWGRPHESMSELNTTDLDTEKWLRW